MGDSPTPVSDDFGAATWLVRWIGEQAERAPPDRERRSRPRPKISWPKRGHFAMLAAEKGEATMRRYGSRGLLAAVATSVMLSTGFAQDALFGEGQDPDLRVEVRDLKRGDGGVVTLRLRLVNGSASAYDASCSMRDPAFDDSCGEFTGAYLLDATNKKKYTVVRDFGEKVRVQRDRRRRAGQEDEHLGDIPGAARGRVRGDRRGAAVRADRRGADQLRRPNARCFPSPSWLCSGSRPQRRGRTPSSAFSTSGFVSSTSSFASLTSTFPKWKSPARSPTSR